MTAREKIRERLRDLVDEYERTERGGFVVPTAAEAVARALDEADRILADEEPATDPRRLGGGIAGPGGPYDENAVVIDTQNAVVLEAVEVAIVGAVRRGVLDEKPVAAVVLRGRVNKTSDRVQVLYLANEDGAAGIVTELVGLASRAGWGDEFLSRVRERMEEMPL